MTIEALPSTQAELDALRNTEATESAFLEFKSSRMLAKSNKELFQGLAISLSAFANAGGGTLIFGAEEDKSRNTIKEFSPITDSKKDALFLRTACVKELGRGLQILKF